MRRGACLILLFAGWLLAAESAHAVELTRTPYNQPQITETGTTTELRVTDRPAGVSYRASLDPSRTYRVRLRGRMDQNGMVLRIGRDGAFEYTRTPPSLTALQVTGVTDLELLIFRHYEDDDERYRIDEVSVTACPDCPDEADLRAQVLAEAPGLAEAVDRGDDLAVSTAVMRWVGRRVAVPGGTPALKVVGRDRTAVELYYGHFANAEAGVHCSGIADFMRKVLALFDVPSFEVDFGDPAVYTHAVVLVPSRGDWYLFDPTFDVVPARAETGELLPVFEVLELWWKGRSDQIDLQSGSLAERPIVYDPDLDGTPNPLKCGDDPTSGWSGCSLANLAHDWDTIFEANGLGRGYEAMFALLVQGQVFSPAELDVPDAFVAKLNRLRDAIAAGEEEVPDLPLPPEMRRAASISGTPAVGASLTVDPGEWDLNPGRWKPSPPDPSTTSVAVAWRQCADECRTVPGATATTFVPGADAAGMRVEAVVTPSNPHGAVSVVLDAGRVAGAPPPQEESSATPSPATPGPVTYPLPSGSSGPRCAARARVRVRRRGARRRAIVRLCSTAPAGWRVHIEIRRKGGARSSRIVRVKNGRTRVVSMRLGTRRARISVRRAGRCGTRRCWRLLASRGVVASPG